MRFSQKIKRCAFLFLLSSILFLKTNALCQDNPDNTRSSEIMIDGIQNEKIWSSIPFQIINKNNVEIKFKIYSANSHVYLLVVFPSEKEKRTHRPWHWNPLKQIYLSGSEKEDELYVLWSVFPLNASPDAYAENSDVWIWRAARTDPAGFADDCYLINNSISNISDSEFADLVQDNGKSCWFDRYFGAFEGNTLSRFYQRNPEGSLADVKAKGAWNSGFWTIEFSRKINTGNTDDIDFGGTEGLAVSFSLTPPKKNFLKLSEFQRIPEIK